MNTIKKLGIWMDHANAHLIEYTTAPHSTTVSAGSLTHEAKQESDGNNEHSEHTLHNKEQHQQSAYYKKLGEAISNYDAVLLFGPTDAKQELFNLLSSNHHFEKIKFEVKGADKMTENQQHAFVAEHFSQH